MEIKNFGKEVCLKTPYKGYKYGRIVGRNGYLYIIQLSSGLELECYDDEFDIE